jgi:metal-responsive CopG/Arc/MetJ family transcriptional regulator
MFDKRIIKTVRLQIVLPEWLKIEVLKASEERGISMSEFIKDCIKEVLSRKTDGGR